MHCSTSCHDESRFKSTDIFSYQCSYLCTEKTESCGELAELNEPPSRRDRKGFGVTFVPIFSQALPSLLSHILLQYLRAMIKQVIFWLFGTAVVLQSPVYCTTQCLANLGLRLQYRDSILQQNS